MQEDKNDHRVVGNPGAALKRLRAAKGWTLAEVRERTGLPIPTLSKLENGKMGLSYDKLMKLGQGLGVDVAELLSAEPSPNRPAPQLVSGRRMITRKGEQQVMETPRYSYALHAADLLNRSIHPMLVEVKARSIEAFGELSRHEGEEFSCVIDGSIEFHCELYAPVLLNEGDSIYFDAGMGHAYIAASPGLCRIFSVSTDMSHD